MRTRRFQGYVVGVKFAVSMAVVWTRFDLGRTTNESQLRLLGEDEDVDNRSMFDGDQLASVLDLASDLLEDGLEQGLVVEPVFVEVPKANANRTKRPQDFQAVPTKARKTP